MNWRASIDTHKKMILNSLIVFFLLGLIVILYATFSGSTYIRLVDTADGAVSSASAPGADINAIEIHKLKKGNSIFASEVIQSTVPQEIDGVTNNYADTTSLLSNPDLDATATYTSLGGGEVIVRLEARLSSGDRVLVHEIGATDGLKAEHFDVYIGTSKDGPWELLGTGAGPTSFTIE